MQDPNLFDQLIRGNPVHFKICHRCLGIGPLYRYQGCYNDNSGAYLGGDRTLPQTYDNFRTGVGIDECAAAARSRGFPVFALQGKGLCFFGSMADVARIQASLKLYDDKCSSLPCPASAATCPERINKVYVLIGVHTPLRSGELKNVLIGHPCGWAI
jgi:hypothetical protein